MNAVFVSNILENYDESDYPALFDIAKGYDLSDPNAKVPMELYNELCDWIERKLGKFNLIKVGRTIGRTVFDAFLQFGMIKEGAKPIDIMQALKVAADTMIQDPEKRGWEILSSEPKKIIMRRTQSFNGKLQIGLIDGLVRKSGVMGLKVDFYKEVEVGDPYDEYIITWL